MAYQDFVKVAPADPNVEPGMWWAFVEGRDGEPEMIDDAFESEAEAVLAGKSYKKVNAAIEEELRKEVAREAGMLHGIDGYNEVMGY